ncbi:MAG: TlpA disulfide reductase family protein [Clostridia bacterium]
MLILVAIIYYINIDKSDYVYLEDRKSYIIKEADNTFLDKYLSNKKTMVVFTASWCKYCVEEQEELNTFIKENKDKKIIIVSHDKNYEDLEKYLKDNNFNWFVILDKDKTIREHIDPGSSGIPSTYLLDKKKSIISMHKGTLTKDEFNTFFNEEMNVDIY